MWGDEARETERRAKDAPVAITFVASEVEKKAVIQGLMLLPKMADARDSS